VSSVIFSLLHGQEVAGTSSSGWSPELLMVDIVIEFGSVSMLRCFVFSVVCVVSCRVAFFLAVPLRNAWSLWGSGRREAHTRASRLQPYRVVFLARSLILPACC